MKSMSIRSFFRMFAVTTVIVAAATSVVAQQPVKPDATIVTVSDTVVTPGIERFGVNLGEVPMKERFINGSFEGTLYRTMSFGPGGDAKSYIDWFGLGAWDQVLKGGNYMFVTGPRKGIKGKVVDVVQELYPPRPDKGKMAKYIFDQEGPVPGENDVILVEGIDDKTGFLGQHGAGYWVFIKGGAAAKTEAGDVRPGSLGKIAAVLTASAPDDKVELMAGLGDKDNAVGVWNLRLWAKGTGTLKFAFGEWNHRVGSGGVQETTVALTPQWKEHVFTFTFDKYPEGWSGGFAIIFQVTGGTCKLDDLSMVRAGDKNPTAFGDDVVATLKQLNPGTIRFLNMGGGSMDNMLAPREERRASNWSRMSAPPASNIWPSHPKSQGNAEIMSYSIPEFLALCEEIKANPWVCLPGAMYFEEMTDFMEYLGGPVTSKYGKLRADLGHPKPWTEVFTKINIEIGNEAWNYTGSGNQNYWNELFAVGRKSPYFRPSIVLNGGGQAVHVGRNSGVGDITNVDAVAVAPYVIHEMSKAEAALPEEEFWSFAFGYPWYHEHTGYMMQNYKEVTQKRGKALSVYEVNYHITGGDAPTPPRNRIITGIGGGVNLANHMLMMLELEKIKVQNLFTLNQFAFFNDVRLWGIVTKPTPDEKNHRPTFLASRMLNPILRGDLVTATKSGADPKWLCTKEFDKGQKPFEVPYLHAYSTRDGRVRGLALLNLHRSAALPVVLNFPGKAKPGSVVISRMEADKIDANNEPEHEPQVFVKEEKPVSFVSGSSLTLKPYSMTVIKWENESIQ